MTVVCGRVAIRRGVVVAVKSIPVTINDSKILLSAFYRFCGIRADSIPNISFIGLKRFNGNRVIIFEKLYFLGFLIPDKDINRLYNFLLLMLFGVWNTGVFVPNMSIGGESFLFKECRINRFQLRRLANLVIYFISHSVYRSLTFCYFSTY